MVQALLEADADVNAKNEEAETALKIATGQGHAEIVQLLREAGATE